MGSHWTEWVCPGNLELEIIVPADEAPAFTLRNTNAAPAPEDAALRACLVQMLGPIRNVGFAQRAQIVFPVAVLAAYRKTQVSGCGRGDNPTLEPAGGDGVPDVTGAQPTIHRAPPSARSL